LFNLTTSFLLVKPSQYVKQQFQTLLSQSIDDINVFVFDDQETDIEWLLSVASNADYVIIDIDNCDITTKMFVTFLLAQPNAHYLTSDELTPYKLISRNRIYDLEWIKDLTDDEEDDEQE
jgi:hypothetical protein